MALIPFRIDYDNSSGQLSPEQVEPFIRDLVERTKEFTLRGGSTVPTEVLVADNELQRLNGHYRVERYVILGAVQQNHVKSFLDWLHQICLVHLTTTQQSVAVNFTMRGVTNIVRRSGVSKWP